MRVIIVGAGLAGLAAAAELHGRGHEVVVLEKEDAPGGRVQTDAIDGFLLDRGFQILLTGYPEARRFFDYQALELCRFRPGALIRYAEAFHRVADPFREPSGILHTLRAPIGGLLDKARILSFRRQVSRGTLDELWQRDECTAAERLQKAGFSTAMIERFLRPLFTGITLDPELEGSSRVLEFVFRMLAAGDNAVPRLGMGQLGRQLADGLPDGAVCFGAPVAGVSARSVTLQSGEKVEGDAVIMATDMSSAHSMTGTEARKWKSVTSVWFAADDAPVADGLLVLNGTGSGAVNSMVNMTAVSPSYSPPGQHNVVATSMADGPDIAKTIRAELSRWFPAAAEWRELRVDRIECAQPRGAPRAGYAIRDGVVVCGDHLADSSINGALESGRLAAAAVHRQAMAA